MKISFIFISKSALIHSHLLITGFLQTNKSWTGLNFFMPYFQYWENRSCIHFFFLFKLFLDTFICSALVTFLYSGLFKWLWLCSIFTPRKFFTGKFWSNGRCLRFVKLVCKIDRKEQRNKYARAGPSGSQWDRRTESSLCWKTVSATLHSCFSWVRWTLEEGSVSAGLFHVLSKVSVPKKMHCSRC